jgi:transketolase
VSATPLRELARAIRRDVVEMAYRSGGPHAGSALSCADILAALYGRALRLDPWHRRDVFILSKAHAAMALYAALAARGVLPRERLERYGIDGGSLPAHLDLDPDAGIECSAGSLGHGFGIGLGMAYGFRRRGEDRKVFILLGDGETQEGSVWEGALFAPRLGLDNVTAIVDCNNLQGYGRPRELCSFEPAEAKWEAFGWRAARIDGHDPDALADALLAPADGRPRVLLADTVKGKGVSFMEDRLVWHYYVVTAGHRARALEDLS